MWEKNIDLFKPSYVWPNPAFHFRLYYESDKCRIFIIENIAHNWNWLKEHHQKFKKNDFFFVSLGWYFDEYLVSECNHIFEILALNKDRFYFMYNSFSDKTLFEYYGFKGEMINQNCFLDENLFIPKFAEKKYDAIYTARLSEFKRHYLAKDVVNLALVAGDTNTCLINNLPPHTYKNEKHLSPDEVIQKLAESRVGLILSEFEGACYASSEYLLCGLPVVSTRSSGGRDIWYNSYNSIICNPDENSVAEAVKNLASLNRDPNRIRSMHIALSKHFRKKFIDLHQMILCETNDSSDASEWFSLNFKNKLFSSEKPNFNDIFNGVME